MLTRRCRAPHTCRSDTAPSYREYTKDRYIQDFLQATLATLALFAVASTTHAAASTCTDGHSLPAGFPEFVCQDATAAAALYQNPRSYRILRKGKTIGTHKLNIKSRRAAGRTEVSVKVSSRIKVRVLKIPVFRFNYDSSELWVDGLLDSVQANTTENGNTLAVSARRQGEQLVLDSGGNSSIASDINHTSNHWYPAVLISGQLFNTLTGKRNDVSVQMLGETNLSLPHQSLPAWHFRYSGNLQADVWYDFEGKWVQLEFIGKDGSSIVYQYEGSGA